VRFEVGGREGLRFEVRGLRGEVEVKVDGRSFEVGGQEGLRQD